MFLRLQRKSDLLLFALMVNFEARVIIKLSKKDRAGVVVRSQKRSTNVFMSCKIVIHFAPELHAQS